MKTDDLIAVLAQGAGPRQAVHDVRRMAMGAMLALPVMVAAVFWELGLVPLAGWPASGTLPKLCYAAVLAGAGVVLLRRTGRPGASVAVPLMIVAAVLTAALLTGGIDLWRQPVANWPRHIFGHSSLICPFAILILSLPAMAGTLWAARLLAPVQLRLAGAACGLAAGGLAAFAYSLGCTEGALTFVALWYTGGVALATLAGALIGPRALRW